LTFLDYSVYHYLHIKLANIKSTRKEPHLYLNAIAHANYIKLLEEYFFNDHKNEDSLYSSLLINVDRTSKTLTVEYEVVIEYDISDQPITKWESKVYSFGDSLHSTLRIEYLAFCKNLELHFKGDSTIKSKQAYFKKLVGIISERYQRVESMTSHSAYLHLLKKYFNRLAKKIYEDYHGFLPKHLNVVFSKLKATELVDDPIGEPSLQVGVYDDLKSLSDEKGRIIFRIQESPTTRKDFRHLIYGQPEKMKEPIRVTASQAYISSARYLIYQLCFNAGVIGFDKKGAQMFLLNSKPLTVNSTYTAIFRIKRKNGRFKKYLDEIITKHVQ